MAIQPKQTCYYKYMEPNSTCDTTLAYTHCLPASEATDINKSIFAETEHFFVIPGLGSTTPGYVIIVSKSNQFPFALLPEDQRNEAQWLVQNVREIIEQTYQTDSLLFEHAAVGNTPNAACADFPHMHIAPVPRNTHKNQDIQHHNQTLPEESKVFQADATKALDTRDAISKTLANRISFTPALRNIRLEDLQLSDTNQQTPLETAYELARQGRSYVYFDGPKGTDCQFTLPYQLHTHKAFQALPAVKSSTLGAELIAEEAVLGSQFGREIVSHMWGMQDSAKAPIWNWRVTEHEGRENMLRSKACLAKPFSELAQTQEARQYQFKTYLVPQRSLTTGQSTQGLLRG